MATGDAQHEGSVPLLEPAVLVVTNCEPCRGTGYMVVTDLRPSIRGDEPPTYDFAQQPWKDRDPLATDVPNRTVAHEDCDGSGRVVQEVPLSEFVAMAGAVTFRYAAPSPSEVRGGH